MFISMDFIAGGLVELVGGLAAAVVLAAYTWWAPLVLAGAWLATHWLLRESAVWRDRETAEVREAQRHADYAYRLAVEPAPAKEVRSEEHTSELQSPCNLVCRLLLEKKNTKMQLDNQKEIAEMQNETQKEIA